MIERSILLGAALWLSGCVSQSLGYSEVQSALEERTGYQARWKHMDGAESNGLAERLLAQPLSADAAAQVALLNSPEVQVAFEELGLARADLVRAFRLPNPTVEAGLRFRPGQDTPDIDVAVMLDLTELATLPWSKQAQDSSMQAAQARVAGQLLDIVLDTKRAFYEYQAAEQQLRLERSAAQAAGAALTLAEQLHGAGNIPDLSLSIERARYDETRLQLARAEAEVTSARERLNQQMGLWGHGTHWRATELAPPGEPPHELASVEQRALQASLDLRTAEHGYAAAARRANLASVRGVLPELKAGVAAEREEDGWGVGPAVELELPIFYQGQGDVAAAEAEMRREHSRHGALAIRIRSAVRAAARNLVVTRDAAIHYRDRLLPERERIVEQTQLMYNAMSVGAFELLQARRDQVRTASAYLNALKDYWIARTELDQLLAGRLVDVAPLRSAAAPSAEPRGGH
jgi:outer membrane protein, heavy metal efflux system